MAKALKSKDSHQKIPSLQAENKLATRTVKKAEAIMDSLEKQFTPNLAGEPKTEVHVWMQLQDFSQAPPDVQMPKEFTLEEVDNIIQKLQKGKLQDVMA